MRENDTASFFEALYVEAERERFALPWDRGGPHPLLEEWARELEGAGRRSLVVGSAFGPDAELICERGFEVIGFDFSPTAIEAARRRFPRSRVDYRVADLFDLPAEWTLAFDLVVESLTVQSIPLALHDQAIASIAGALAPGGTLLVIATGRDDPEPPDGPPWPLVRGEIESYADHGLERVRIEELRETDAPLRWRAEFRRNAP